MPTFAERIARVDRSAQGKLGGEPVSYTPEGGSPVNTTPSGAPLLGIFSEEYILVKGSAEAGVEALGPAVFLRLEDLPTNPQDDEPTLTIRGNDYRVTERRPDGMGGIVLAVRRRS